MGTHTYARLDVSQATYKEIKHKLKAAGYDHAFMEDGVIDMHGIGIAAPYEATTENVMAHLNSKLNEAVDKIAADNGISHDEVLDNARKILNARDNGRMRDYLTINPDEKEDK